MSQRWSRSLMGFSRFVQNRMAVISLIFLIIISILAVLAPLVTKNSYEVQNIERKLEAPSHDYWFGTDSLGRDLYSRVIYGARVSLAVGVVTALLALIVGTIVGAIAGFRGGWFDIILMRIVDLFYIFPSLLLAILLTLLLGRGVFGIVVALGMTAWVTQARLIRGQILQAKEFPYVEAARAIGATDTSIIFKHILPNLWGPILVSLTVQIPANIMSESFLSFIGLGVQPPYSSWGTLANEGFRAMKSFPHLILFPGAVLFVSMVAFNYFGDGLRDWLDPKSDRKMTLG